MFGQIWTGLIEDNTIDPYLSNRITSRFIMPDHAYDRVISPGVSPLPAYPFCLLQFAKELIVNRELIRDI